MATIQSLRDLGLSAGQARHEELELQLEPYRQAGEHYATATPTVPARLDIVAMTEGLSFRLRFSSDLTGPCSRCLEPAALHVDIDSHEVHDPQSDDDQLRSDFVDDQAVELDVTAWAQEAIGLEFPTRVLCREDCAGLCPVCGENLNVSGPHEHEKPPDSRWEKLRELQLEDGDADG